MGVAQAAYGFRVTGIQSDGALALRGAGDWPILSVERRVEPHPPAEDPVINDREASIQTPAGRLSLERAGTRMLVRSTQPVPDSVLVHPCLWPAAAVFARWRGAETLHAGAFLAPDGGAWAVLGGRGAGKSALLAALALTGREILADDLVVVEQAACYAGPRCVDLRPDAAAALGLEGATTVVRSTRRRRLALPPAQGSVRLRGFVHLDGHPQLAVASVAPAEHFGLLVRHRRIASMGAELSQLFDLAGLPALRLNRPRRWENLQGTVAALLDAVTAPGSPRPATSGTRPRASGAGARVR